MLFGLAVLTAAVPAASAASAPGLVAKAKSPGAISARLLDASVNRRDDPRARLYINDHVPPGSTVIRHVEIANTSKRALALKFYADAATVTGGQFAPAAGRGSNELTSWTTVTPSAKTLVPGTRTTLTVTVAVPKGVASGERYGVVLAELPPEKTASGGIGVGARVGVRMYLSVGSGKEPRTDFVVNSLTAARLESGRPEVRAQVQNTGGRALDLAGELSLDEGPGGLRAGPYAVELGTTLGIDQAAPVTVLLDPRLPAGPWHAVLNLRSGQTERSAEATITFPAAAGAVGPAVPAKPLTKRPDVVIPVAGGLLGLLALGFLVLFLLLRRRKKDKDDDSDPDLEAVRRPVVAGATR